MSNRMTEKIIRWISVACDRRFWLVLASPDGYSGRTLRFIMRPKANRFSGIDLLSWNYGERPKLEQFLHKIGIYEAY